MEKATRFSPISTWPRPGSASASLRDPDQAFARGGVEDLASIYARGISILRR
jgi:hypothetical protein